MHTFDKIIIVVLVAFAIYFFITLEGWKEYVIPAFFLVWAFRVLDNSSDDSANKE